MNFLGLTALLLILSVYMLIIKLQKMKINNESMPHKNRFPEFAGIYENGRIVEKKDSIKESPHKPQSLKM